MSVVRCFSHVTWRQAHECKQFKAVVNMTNRVVRCFSERLASCMPNELPRHSTFGYCELFFASLIFAVSGNEYFAVVQVTRVSNLSIGFVDELHTNGLKVWQPRDSSRACCRVVESIDATFTWYRQFSFVFVREERVLRCTAWKNDAVKDKEYKT